MLFRSDLAQVRHKFDPESSARSLDNMVLIGHSMGGLLAKMMVQETGHRLWQVVSDRPPNELAGEPEDLELFRSVLFYTPRREVRRVVFIATPHRGSQLDRGPVGHLGSRLVRLPDPLRASYNRLIARNNPSFFNERFRKGLPTSFDELEWKSPILMRSISLASRRTRRPIRSSPSTTIRPKPAAVTGSCRMTVPTSTERRPSCSSRRATSVRTSPRSSAKSSRILREHQAR